MRKEGELQKTKKPTMALLKPVEGKERKKGKGPAQSIQPSSPNSNCRSS